MSTDLTKLMGQAEDAPEVQQFIAGLGDPPKMNWEDGAPDRHYVDFKNTGLCFLVRNDSKRIGTIFFYADGTEKRPGYKGVLPHGVSFAWDRAATTAHLGPPDKKRPISDEWDHGTYKLLVEFRKDGRVRLVVLTGY